MPNSQTPNIQNTQYELVPLGRLTPHPKNARQGDVGAVYQSIEANGFFGALVVQRSTHHILVGNHRFLAARDAKMPEVPVLWVDVDDERALRILLADNKTSDDASYDTQALADLLAHLANTTEAGLVGTGFTGDELDDLIQDLLPKADKEDKAQAEPEEPTRLGVLVLCDDADEQEHVYQRLVDIGWMPKKTEVTERSITSVPKPGAASLPKSTRQAKKNIHGTSNEV